MRRLAPASRCARQSGRFWSLSRGVQPWRAGTRAGTVAQSARCSTIPAIVSAPAVKHAVERVDRPVHVRSVRRQRLRGAPLTLPDIHRSAVIVHRGMVRTNDRGAASEKLLRCRRTFLARKHGLNAAAVENSGETVRRMFASARNNAITRRHCRNEESSQVGQGADRASGDHACNRD
jgi:hypothetical protein